MLEAEDAFEDEEAESVIILTPDLIDLRVVEDEKDLMLSRLRDAIAWLEAQGETLH